MRAHALLLLATPVAAMQLAPRLAPRASPARMQFGNPFDNVKNPFKGRLDGGTTISLTLSFQCPERGPTSVLGQLDSIAARADTNTEEGFSDFCKDLSLMLLRKNGEWLSCCGNAEFKGKDEDALTIFDRKAIQEAAKFDDRSSGATVDAALAAAGVGSGDGAGGAPPTMAVVCVLACIAGDRENVVPRSFSGDASATKRALEELAAAGSAVGEVLALELFWVPGEVNEVLDTDELIMDWPELMPC